MKANTELHIKFKRLKRALGLPSWQIVGVLESIWLLTASSARRGDIGRLSDEDIAAAIEWEGDGSALIAALVECGWLDKSTEHRLVVHDWHDHAPNYIKGGFSKAGIEFASQNSSQDPSLATSQATSNQLLATKSSQVKSSNIPPLAPPPGGGSLAKKKPTPKKYILPPIPDNLAGEAFAAAWEDWQVHRREKGKRLTNRAAKMQLSRLSEWGLDRAIAALRFSVGQGYEGVFEEGGNGGGKRQAQGAVNFQRHKSPERKEDWGYKNTED